MIRYYPFQHGSHGNSAVLVLDDYAIIMDAGVSRTFIEDNMLFHAGVKLRTKKIITLITHTHVDHSRAMEEWSNTTVISPMTHEEHIGEGRRVVHEDIAVHGNSLIIEKFDMKHNCTCWGYLITYGTRKIVWFTDTKIVPNDPALHNADAYLVEANYSLFLKSEVNMDDLNEKFRYLRGRERHLSVELLIPWLNKAIGPNTKDIRFLHLSTRQDNLEIYKKCYYGLDNKTINITASGTSETPAYNEPTFTYDFNPFGV